MAEITLAKLRRTRFFELYKKLIIKSKISDFQLQGLYKLAIIFLNRGDDQVRKLGYKVLLKSSFYENLYRPIYDVSVNLGYYPITKFIDNMSDDNEKNHFLNLFLSSFLENFKQKNIYLTEQQEMMIKVFEERNSNTIAVIAPTSYGKSELIINSISINSECNICIIVPTKALLSQTKRRILKSESFPVDRKIITHPDMYQNSDRNFIAILTQERLLRLLEKQGDLNFKVTIIDEAHNLFNDDSRNRLLADSIAILYNRNPEISFKFLSPFLIDCQNLKVISCNYDIIEQKITEHLKVNNYYCIDLKGDCVLNYYDQFLNNFIPISSITPKSDIEFVIEKASEKNIIYLNSPPKLEKLAMRIAEYTTINISPKIYKACNEIATYLHKDYNLIHCLKNGVVYHHGSVPDIVKLYIEDLYTSEPELKYIVCSSTLLEGVNIPAENLFLLDYRKGRGRLTPSQFKNLTGRICRFSEIFNKHNRNLGLLEPDIYIIKSGYIRADANIRKFLQDCVKEDKKVSDKLENVLLEKTIIDKSKEFDFNKEEEFLVNFEPGISSMNEHDIASTDIGKLCFKNSLKEINIIENEEYLQERVDILINSRIKAASATEVIEMISIVFLDFIEDNNTNRNIFRLQKKEAQAFYSMFLDWIMRSAPFNELIGRFLAYWGRLIRNKREALVFVGKWGDVTRGGHRPLWIDLRQKSQTERVNLAIIKIKEEQDFVENIIVKFIEILNDSNLIEEDIYKKGLDAKLELE